MGKCEYNTGPGQEVQGGNCGRTRQDRAEWRQSEDRKKKIEDRVRKGARPNKDTTETGEDSIRRTGWRQGEDKIGQGGHRERVGSERTGQDGMEISDGEDMTGQGEDRQDRVRINTHYKRWRQYRKRTRQSRDGARTGQNRLKKGRVKYGGSHKDRT